jgi:hypothetical protein
MISIDIQGRVPTEPCEIVTHHTALQRYLVSLCIFLGLLDQLPHEALDDVLYILVFVFVRLRSYIYEQRSSI